MSDHSIALSTPAFSSATANPPLPNRPTAARTKLLLEGRILPTLLRVAAPNVLNLLAIAGMVTFDGLFLGRLGAATLAGVSLAFPWVMFMQHAANGGMGGGVSSAIARALGAGRRDKADALVYHAFVLAIAVAAIFSASMLLGAPYVFDGWEEVAKWYRPRSPIPMSHLADPFASSCSIFSPMPCEAPAI
jgi:Na+-driven multidrug efflux pump